jgi:hypothetical protein
LSLLFGWGGGDKNDNAKEKSSKGKISDVGQIKNVAKRARREQMFALLGGGG